MTDPATPAPPPLTLRGLDGANPLGFLAALGTLQTLTSANPETVVSMSWGADSLGWRPIIHGLGGDLLSLSRQIATHLKCPFRPDPDAESRRQSAMQRYDAARARLRVAEAEIKRRRLKGKEREGAQEQEIGPLREQIAHARQAWLTALRECVPSPELSLGKHLNASGEEFREASLQALGEANLRDREVVDFFASFGSDACILKDNVSVQATPFCFITGSGHQYFLDTVRQLTASLDASRIEHALSQTSLTNDEKLSMRWDPLEDRRYALMWNDPTASGNTAKTNWALNLLAYRGLLLTPSVPTAKGLRTSGWSSGRDPEWTWPLWEGPVSVAVVRSLLTHPALAIEDPDPEQISALGIRAVYRSNRIQVGNPPLHKVNFTPARRIA